MTDIHAMLPKDKCDTEQAQALVALGYPAVEPIVPHIRAVFETDNECWKMQVMRHLVETSPAVFEAVRGEIQRMADISPQNEDEEALQEVAQEVLVHYGVREP